jgi:hypothetical protein
VHGVCRLRGALEALFCTGAADYLVTLAETNSRALGAVGGPELFELCFQIADLGDHRRVETLG